MTVSMQKTGRLRGPRESHGAEVPSQRATRVVSSQRDTALMVGAGHLLLMGLWVAGIDSGAVYIRLVCCLGCGGIWAGSGDLGIWGSGDMWV